jgi:hypothetical protein
VKPLPFLVANFLQIISPCALATAYFTMPQAVIPFKLDSKSFIIAIIVIMGLVRLSFVFLCALPHHSWWWKKIKAGVQTMHLDELSYGLPAIDFCSGLTIRRGRNQPDSTANSVEMNTFRV